MGLKCIFTNRSTFIVPESGLYGRTPGHAISRCPLEDWREGIVPLLIGSYRRYLQLLGMHKYNSPTGETPFDDGQLDLFSFTTVPVRSAGRRQ